MMNAARAMGLLAAGLLSGCSGIVENHASPANIRLADFQAADSGIVVMSTGAEKDCAVYSKFLYVKDARTGSDVSGVPLMSMDVYAVKSDFPDHYGTVNALALRAGKYLFSPRNANWQVVSKTTVLIPFEVVAGQTTYLGELFMSPSCAPASRLVVRDQYARDMRVLIARNPVFAQRPVVKHVLLDAKDIGGADNAAELKAAQALPAKWNGTLRCNARTDAGPAAAAFEARIAMEMTDGMATIRRSSADVAESLSGAVSGMEMELHGEGHRVGEPGRAWQYRLKGSFIQNGASVLAYSATGGMLVNGTAVRSCSVSMAPL
jgi:hypothetical protein